MVYRQAVWPVAFHNGISGAFHCACMPQPAQNSAHQRGFAGAQIAFQPHHQRCGQIGRDSIAEGFGGGFVVEKERETVLHAADYNLKYCWESLSHAAFSQLVAAVLAAFQVAITKAT